MEVTNAPRVVFKRRKQVKTACLNCRRSKTACDVQRPCRRCLGLGIGSSCKDAPRKKSVKTDLISEQHTKRKEEKQLQYSIALDDSTPTLTTKVEKFQTQNLSFIQAAAPPVYDTNAYNDTIYEQKNLLSKINGQHANEENEDEKALLYSQIAQLEQENNRLNVTIGSLTNMLQSQRIFAAMPLTRWKVISPGVCRLLSYSNAFLELTRHQPEKLHSCFTCVQLYPAKEFSKTQGFFDLISSGRVESFTARVPIVCASGHVVDIFSMIKIEFHNGIPATVCVCMKDFDHLHQEFENMPYFRPFMVKLRGARNMSSPDVNLEASLHCSPPLAMSVGEPTNLSPGHSNHPHMNERNSPPLQSTMAVGRPTHPYSPDHPTHSRMNERNSPTLSVVTNSSNVLSPVEQSLLEDSCMLMNFQVPINTERRQTDQSPGHEPSSGSSCSTYFNWSQNQVFEPFATTSNLFTDKDFGQSVRKSGCFTDPKAELGFNVDDFPFRQDPEFPRAKPLLQFEI